LQHPNIIRLLDRYEYPEGVVMVMDYCQGTYIYIAHTHIYTYIYTYTETGGLGEREKGACTWDRQALAAK
jgi:serine/threonine protein kinase